MCQINRTPGKFTGQDSAIALQGQEMKLIIVRHGETRANLEDRLQGQTGGGLTELGRQQARLLAERLRVEPIDSIFSSDLQRALETTREISIFHPIRVQVVPEIREWNLGKLSGQSVERLRNAVSEAGGLHPEFRPQCGESLNELIQRADAFARMVFSGHADRTALIVSHGMFNRAMISVVLKKELVEAFGLSQDNACVNVIKRIGIESFDVSLINCTRHLDASGSSAKG